MTQILSRTTIFFGLVHVIFLVFYIWHLVSYNHTFSNPENWSTFDLSYNETQVGSIALTYSYKPLWFVAVASIGAYGITVLVGVTLMIFMYKGHPFTVSAAFICTLFPAILIIPMLFSTPDAIYPREDMTPPWKYSPDGFLRLDYSTSSKGYENDDGYILKVECPDGSTRSTETYGRIFTAELLPNPPTFTPRPLCAYYYSSIQGKLFALCCGLKKNAVSSPLFRYEGQDLFRALLVGYFSFLIIWFISIVLYTNWKRTPRVSSYEVYHPSVIQVRERSDTAGNPLNESQ